MSNIAYYNPNDYILISAITDTGGNCNMNQFQSCSNDKIKNALVTNKNLTNQLKNTTAKNITTQKLYKDSGIFYSTQYIQLWNMTGGIVAAGAIIYYLVKQQKLI